MELSEVFYSSGFRSQRSSCSRRKTRLLGSQTRAAVNGSLEASSVATTDVSTARDA
jgi:hypothetical protein